MTALAAAAGPPTREVRFDAANGTVVVEEIRRLGAIVLDARRVPARPDDDAAAILLAVLRARGLNALGWPSEALHLRQRLACVHRHLGGDWPDVSDDALLASLDDWLGPYATGARSLADLAAIDLGEALLARVPSTIARPRDALARLVPTHVEVPSGSRLPIDYGDPDAPVLAVRIQEMFGARQTPTVLAGALPLTLHLLSPAHRPMQVTRDLASFWAQGYADVRKDLRGRYPRHPWPDDPTTAPATRRAKPRGT